jgi:hypothetical protein
LTFIVWEHKGRRSSSEVRDFEYGEGYDDLAAFTDEVGIEDNEGDEDESPFEEVVVKEEVPVPPSYEEEATFALATEEYMAAEEVKFLWEVQHDVARLTAMVAEHNASLPPSAASCVGRADGCTTVFAAVHAIYVPCVAAVRAMHIAHNHRAHLGRGQ